MWTAQSESLLESGGVSGVKGNGKAVHAGEKQMGGVWRSSADGSG